MNCAIGLDLGGTTIKYALVDEEGQVLFENLAPTEADKSRETVINNLARCATEMKEWAQANNHDVLGVGIGTPGVIDNGLVLGGAENLPDWESLPLGGILSRRLQVPVYVDNDANMMGRGEVRYGCATNTLDAIFLTVGTGVGGAMVLNGKLYGGHRNRGAELGHVIVDQDGELCSCGAKGCLEAHASTTALIRDYQTELHMSGKLCKQEINGRLIVAKYKEKEQEAVNAMNRHFDYLAKGIVGFINVFSPQKVIIGGGISEAGDFYVENISQRALAMAMKETSVFTQIQSASLGNKAGFLGAAALVFDSLSSVDQLNLLTDNLNR
jgi:glucokinase